MKKMNNRQRGFTLVEIIIAMGIASIILSAIGYSVVQLFNMNTRNTLYMTAVRQVQTAGYWLTRDTVMASADNIFVLNTDPAKPQLILNWRSDPNTLHQTIYTYDAATGILWRAADSGGDDRIAEHLTTMTFTQTADAGITDSIDFGIVATVTVRNISGTEARNYSASPRSRVFD